MNAQSYVYHFIIPFFWQFARFYWNFLGFRKEKFLFYISSFLSEFNDIAAKSAGFVDNPMLAQWYRSKDPFGKPKNSVF